MNNSNGNGLKCFLTKVGPIILCGLVGGAGGTTALRAFDSVNRNSGGYREDRLYIRETLERLDREIQGLRSDVRELLKSK